jgi:hypothetical protein
LVGTSKVYPGAGADIVMESITLIDLSRLYCNAKLAKTFCGHPRRGGHTFCGSRLIDSPKRGPVRGDPRAARTRRASLAKPRPPRWEEVGGLPGTRHFQRVVDTLFC